MARQKSYALIEGNKRYFKNYPFGALQLGKRGLYGAFGGRKDSNVYEMAMLWVLNLSDGEYSLLDIAERSGTAFSFILEAAELLLKHDMLREAYRSSGSRGLIDSEGNSM